MALQLQNHLKTNLLNAEEKKGGFLKLYQITLCLTLLIGSFAQAQNQSAAEEDEEIVVTGTVIAHKLLDDGAPVQPTIIVTNMSNFDGKSPPPVIELIPIPTPEEEQRAADLLDTMEDIIVISKNDMIASYYANKIRVRVAALLLYYGSPEAVAASETPQLIYLAEDTVKLVNRLEQIAPSYFEEAKRLLRPECSVYECPSEVSGY